MRKISILILISFFTGLVGTILPQPFFLNTASAASSQEFNLTFSTASEVEGKLYSKQSIIISDSQTVNAPSGSKIKQIDVLQNGVVKQTLVQNVSLSSWRGTVSLSGQAKDVVSSSNKSAKGYFAWYRYGKGTKPGDKWYFGGAIIDPSCTSPSGSSDRDNWGMPATPGCFEHNLSLTGKVDQPYKLSGIIIPNTSVVDDKFVIKGFATKNITDNIDGPRGDGSLDGKTFALTYYKSVDVTSATKFTVLYEQDFNYLGGKTDTLEAYGARVTVYHAAWDVEMTSKTYEYEKPKLVVTYEGDAPPPVSITGEFDILPSNTINWRDSWQLKPKNFVIPAPCTYLYHEYRVEKDGYIWSSSRIKSQSEITSFSYSTYPSTLGVGANNITIKVTADCADSGWVNQKTLYVNSPASNRPPQFSAGFFKEYNRSGIYPDYEVVVNSRVNLRIINDTTKDPAWPYDPDGDPIDYTWLFSASTSPWIRSLPSEYGVWEHDEAFYNLIPTELGVHSIKVIARDSFGAETSRTVSINVIPENPIPIINGPTQVKENRPLPKPFDGSKSYSPMGRTISEYIWQNKKDKYTTAGTETIKLDVVDSAGLTSLSPAVATFTVLPDDPPIGKLDVPPLGIRSGSFDIMNKSTSPDGDKIVSIQYRYKYDANNNGFTDDNWTDLVGGDLIKYTLRPNKVGKFLLDTKVCEDYGKCAYASDTQPGSSRTLDVVNQAPSVSFLVEGKNEEPEPPTNNSGIPVTDIIKKWALYDVNSTTQLTKKPQMWSSDNGKLLAGLGKGMEKQYTFMHSMYYGNNQSEAYRLFPLLTDNGFGPNSLSPYKALVARDPSKSGPILIPTKGSYYTSYTTGDDYDNLVPAQFSEMVRSNDKYIYFDQQYSERDPNCSGSCDNSYVHSYYIFAMNKNRIPGVTSENKVTIDGMWHSIDLAYKWLGTNPYDFIIKIPYYADYKVPYYSYYDVRNYGWETKAKAGDYSGATGGMASVYSMSLRDLEVSGSRIFALYSGCVPVYAYYYEDSSGHSRTNNVCKQNEDVIEVRMYDAFTGQYLGNTVDKNSTKITDNSWGNSDLMVKGENIVVRMSYNWNGNANKYIEYDRSGKIVSMGENTQLNPFTISYKLSYRNFYGQPYTPDQPSDYYCTYSPYNYKWKDDKGGIYQYYVVSCSVGGSTVTSYERDLNPDFPQGVYLVKFNPDNSFAFASKLAGTTAYRPAGPFYDINIESDPLLAINPTTNQAITRTFTVDYCRGCWFPSISENHNTVDLNTGAVGGWGGPRLLEKTDNIGDGFYITHPGGIGGGWRSNSASGTLDKFDFHNGQQMYMSANNYTFNDKSATSLRYGEYVGDGMWLSVYGGDMQGSGPGFGYGYTTTDSWMFLDTGTPSTYEAVKTVKFGQFVSPSAYTDSEYTFKLSLDDPNSNSKLAGLSFRMTDPRNRYAVEVDGSTLYLSKYVNGTRTILSSIAVPFQPKTDYAFKIITQGSGIQVFMNGVPYFDKDDTTFTSGKFGPFSDKSYVSFGNINQKDIAAAPSSWQTNYAIWEDGVAQADIRYSNIVFDDPEKDPMAGNFQWSIQHTPKFLNNQGLSTLNGKTLASPAVKFDKVGNYRVTLKAQDDPNGSYPFPSSVFANYRRWSNDYWQIITVHRRPIAQFSLSIKSTDKTVAWNDQSYDPDRWQSSTVYDTEATGIDYKTTRGVTERRYYYVAPSGATVNAKLVTPQETGTYKVGLQVKDDFGAWSYWAEQQITIDTPVIPDDPPIPGFSLSKTTLYRGDSLTITSTAYDKEDGAAANLPHEYYIQNQSIGDSESMQSTNRGAWNKVFNSVGVMKIRQTVCDSKGQCAQKVHNVTVLNRAPTADFDWSPKPVYEGDTVTLTNKSVDPDGDSLTYAWTISGPNGYTQTGSTEDIAISGVQTVNRPGMYRITLTVKDASGATDSATKNVIVRELGIDGAVLHTDAWEENRIRYNDKHPDAPRPPDWFWAGEAFRLEANVTDTGASATKPVKIEAAASPELQMALTSADSSLALWQGLLRSKDAGTPLDQLPQGSYTFVFTVTFSNGTVKTDNVTVQLKDTVDHYVQVHRIQ